MKPTYSEVLDRWELLTLKADELFYSRQYRKAAKLFYQSVNQIEPHLNTSCVSLPSVLRRFVVGCHNLAVCYGRLADNKEAEYYYHYAEQRLQQLVNGSSNACRFQAVRLNELEYARTRYRIYLTQCKEGGVIPMFTTPKGLTSDRGVRSRAKLRFSLLFY